MTGKSKCCANAKNIFKYKSYILKKKKKNGVNKIWLLK